MKKKHLATLLILSSYLSCTAQPVDQQYEMFRGNVQHSGIYASKEVRKKPAIKWRFKTGGYVNSSIAVEDDRAFFGSGDGYFYCVDANDGSLAWKFKTGGPVHSSPAIVNGVVFFNSHDGNFYALDEKDGKLK